MQIATIEDATGTPPKHTQPNLVTGHFSFWKIKAASKRNVTVKSVEALCMHNGLAHDETLSELTKNQTSRKVIVSLRSMLDVAFGVTCSNDTVILCWPEDFECDQILRRECKERAIFVTDYTLAVQYGSE